MTFDQVPNAINDNIDKTKVPLPITTEQQRADLKNRIENTQSDDTNIPGIVGIVGLKFQADLEAWKKKPENQGKTFVDYVNERNRVVRTEKSQPNSAFSELWSGLIENNKLHDLVRKALAKAINANIQDIVIVNKHKVRIKNRGEKGDAEVAVKENGDYTVTIAGEAKIFFAHQEKELIDFLMV